jgi:hypothetical protein
MTMQGTIRVGVPIGAEAGQLRALASLLSAVEHQRWDALAATFAKMARQGVELDDQLQAMLGQLAGQLRVEARHREPAPAQAAARP